MALLIPPAVVKQFSKLPKADRERLLDALEAVASMPNQRQAYVIELVGHPGLWRARKGDWRAIFRWVEGDVVLDSVAHRREVYR